MYMKYSKYNIFYDIYWMERISVPFKKKRKISKVI